VIRELKEELKEVEGYECGDHTAGGPQRAASEEGLERELRIMIFFKRLRRL
jgi:hypothetical protein